MKGFKTALMIPIFWDRTQ